MDEVFVMVGVAAAAFVSTNLDNLLLLVGLVSGSRIRGRDAAVGYVSALAVVLSVAVAGSYALDLASDRWLRFLGLVPLAMGLWRVRALVTGRADAAEAPAGATPATGTASVFALMLANGGDSLGVFASLMGETRQPLVFVAFATALAMGAVWTGLARWLAAHAALAPRLRALDRYLVPVLLLAIGLYILLDTPTDTV